MIQPCPMCDLEFATELELCQHFSQKHWAEGQAKAEQFQFLIEYHGSLVKWMFKYFFFNPHDTFTKYLHE